MVQVKEEPQELIELGDSDDNGDSAFMFDIDEEANRSMIETLRRRRNRRSASVSSQPRFGPLTDALSPARFGTPTNASRLTICDDEDSDAEPVQTKADFVHAVLTAVQLARLRKYLNFEQLHDLVAGNAFVRLLCGAQKKIDQIVGILCCDEPYECDLLDTKFDMRFQMLWSGVCRLTQIAAQPAEEMADKEFDRWKEEMHKRRLKLPTLEFVAENSAEFSKALAQIEMEHSSDADFPALVVRLDQQEDDLMPAGCFSETDEETDETDETQKRHSSLCASPTHSVPPRPSSRAAASSSTEPPRAANSSPQATILPHQSTQTPGDPPVESAKDVQGALLLRERLIALYTSNPFDQFGRAVTGCFVRINTGQLGYKLDQLDMVSETAMDSYTLKGDRQCRVILHLTLHGRRRINAVAFASCRGNTQTDAEFHEWHLLMTQKRISLPSKRFVALKVGQLTAFSAEKEKPPLPRSSATAPHEQLPQQKDSSISTAADAFEENVANGQTNEKNDDDDVQLVNEEGNEQNSKLTSDDLRSITMTTRDLVELFESESAMEKRREMLTGCFVRVFDHTPADEGEAVHRLHQIVNVQKGAYYRLRNAFSDMHLTLRGESELLRCDNVSGKAFTEEEFEEWAQRTREKEFPSPTKLFIAQKIECLGRSKAKSLSDQNESEAPQPKMKRKHLKKRNWMTLFRTDNSIGEGRGEMAANGVEEKRNRTTPTTTMSPRMSSFSTNNGRTAKYGLGPRRPYARATPLLSLTVRAPSHFSSPFSSTIRHQQQRKSVAPGRNRNSISNDDEWVRKTERFITRTSGFVDNSSSSTAFSRANRLDTAIDAEQRSSMRLERTAGGFDGSWRRTSAPAEHSKTQPQQLLDMDNYVGHRPLSSMSSIEWSGAGERKDSEQLSGYGDAPRAITPSNLSASDFGAASNSAGVVSYFSTPSGFPSSQRPYSSNWPPNSNCISSTTFGNNDSAISTTEPAWSTRRVQAFDAFVGGGGGDSSDEEPMVARARRQVMDSMEPIGDGGSGGGRNVGTNLPWHGRQRQQQQRRISASTEVDQHGNNNFKQFEQSWYNKDNQQQRQNTFKQFEQQWYNNEKGDDHSRGRSLRSSHHYSTPRSHDNPRPQQQNFFSAPSRHSRRISSSPPSRTPGVPSSFFFSTGRR
ncbi:hypothetical protein niasHS_015959 [Heterodera schachtii]|uniref:Plus3 domain-containing protein n=1 Tax=Heterodera schachtii TaxID=97005 RepID=A0ABD2HWA3_HETSC